MKAIDKEFEIWATKEFGETRVAAFKRYKNPQVCDLEMFTASRLFSSIRKKSEQIEVSYHGECLFYGLAMENISLGAELSVKTDVATGHTKVYNRRPNE